MIDLDRFKHINDTYGHAAGDRALMRMADALKRACAERNDFLARIGGDEFVLLCQRESEDEVRQTVDRLRGHLEALNALSDEPFDVAFQRRLGRVRQGGPHERRSRAHRRRPAYVRHQIRPRAHARAKGDEPARRPGAQRAAEAGIAADLISIRGNVRFRGLLF